MLPCRLADDWLLNSALVAGGLDWAGKMPSITWITESGKMIAFASVLAFVSLGIHTLAMFSETRDERMNDVYSPPLFVTKFANSTLTPPTVMLSKALDAVTLCTTPFTDVKELTCTRSVERTAPGTR